MRVRYDAYVAKTRDAMRSRWQDGIRAAARRGPAGLQESAGRATRKELHAALTRYTEAAIRAEADCVYSTETDIQFYSHNINTLV